MVGIPTMGNVRVELEQRLEDYAFCENPKVHVRRIGNVCDVAAARNELIFYHFDPMVYTHLCMIDADTEPPQGFLENMLTADRPVVSAVEHFWKPRKARNVPEPLLALWKRRVQADGTDTYDRIDANPDAAIIEEPGIATGCFCMLIRAMVFVEMRETLGLPWFKTEYEEQTQTKTRSEDIYFCRKLERLGIPVTVLPRLVCRHYKTVPLSEVEAYGRAMFEAGRQSARGGDPQGTAVAGNDH